MAGVKPRRSKPSHVTIKKEESIYTCDQNNNELKSSNLNVSAGGFIYERSASRRERSRSALMKHVQTADVVALTRRRDSYGPGMTSLVRKDSNEMCDNDQAILRASIKPKNARQIVLVKALPTKRKKSENSEKDKKSFGSISSGLSFAEAVARASYTANSTSIVPSKKLRTSLSKSNLRK